MTYYLIKYRPPRPTFTDDATADEVAVIEQHFEYLKKLLAQETLILAGRTEDAHLGIALIKSDSPANASRIMTEDPAVKNGIFTGELHPFRLALTAD